MNITNIAQFGTDGFGHQIHGMASCMALHDKVINDSKIRFDPHWSINERPYSFEHITDEDGLCEQYMKKAFENFAIRNDLQTINEYSSVYPKKDDWPQSNYGRGDRTKWQAFPKFTISKERADPDVLHLYDNLWGTANSTGAMEDYRQDMKLDWVTNNNKLPPNRFSNETTNIAIHVRMGDALKRGANQKLLKNLDAVIEKLINTLDVPQITIHTNGEFKLKDDKSCVEMSSRDTHVLRVLSDLIYSDIIISSHSSLSRFAIWARSHECNIVSVKENSPRKIATTAHIVGHCPTAVISVREFLDSDKINCPEYFK